MFSVSVGSGIRPHPMNAEIEDHMFVLLDETPFMPMAADADISIEIADLEEVVITEGESGKTVGKGEDFEGKKITEVTGKKGWRVKFGQSGEKVLASSITFEGSIIFTTLVPKVLSEGELISVCAAPSTQGRLYAMDLLTGEARMDLDDNESTNDNDVFVTISASEIPGTPQRVFNSLNCVNGSCTHDVDVRIGKKSTEAGTTNVEAIESVYWNSPDPYQ
jgi:type IV pilus assembly protein PilY1